MPAALSLLAVTVQAPPAVRPLPDWLSWPERAVSVFLTRLQRATLAFVDGGAGLVARLTRTRKPDPKAEPSYLEANLGLDDVDLEQLVRGLGLKLPFTITGKISFEVRAAIPLDTPRDLKTYRFTGTATLPHLTLEGLRLEQVRTRVTYRDGILNLEELHGGVPAEIGGAGASREGSPAGTFQGTARLEMIPQGDLTAKLTLDRISLTRVLTLVPGAAEMAEGAVSATVTARAPAARLTEMEAWTVTGDLRAERLRVRGVATERSHGTFSYQGRAVNYAFEGEALGGRFRLNGTVPVAASRPADAKDEGHARLEKVQLPRLWQALDVRAVLGPLQGVVDLDVTFRHEGSARLPVGSGRFVVESLRWGRTNLTGGIRGEVRLTGQEIRLRDLSGTVGQGLLRGQVSLSLRPAGQSWFTLDLSQVEAGQLLAPWPALAGSVQGLMQIRLRGTVGREWSGSSEVTLSRGRVLGAEVAEWRLPLSWSVTPALGRGQIDVRDSSAQVALGRATGRTSFRWGVGNRLEGQLNFHGVQLRPLLRQMADLTTLGDSEVAGRIDFSATDIRSLEDVTATLTATLGRTQAFEFPVFRQLTPYVRPGLSSAATFQRGELRATLARGLVHVQQLSLQGSILQLFAEGTVTLQGRLDLEVLVNTGQLGPNPALLRLLGLRLPAAGPVPLALILEASDYLANRLIRLRVRGTIRSPVVRVDPVALVTDAAVRFFLRQAGGPLR